jgi:predicted thioesterase/2-polyprenyl-3-methyl-5-hydroxy-6-metoxy-1,4-benzoquinol methylase
LSNLFEETSLCASCGSDIKCTEIPFPVFRHRDFSTIAPTTAGCICVQCGLLQRLDSFSEERLSYQTDLYGNSAQTVHKSSRGGKDSRTRSVIQAGYLKKVLPLNAGACLDIGCFDGALLRALRSVMPSVALLGYEVNPLKAIVDIENALEITNSEEQAFCRKFDAVIYSHSIMYIENIGSQLRRIRPQLTDNGFIFVQLPNIEINPLYALMGDQAFVFNENSLRTMLACAGYDCERCDLIEFPKELVFLARPKDREDEKKDSPMNCVEPMHFWGQVFEKIQELRAEILAAIGSQKVYVLGTTVFAAFVHELCPENVLGFVDENYEKLAMKFRGLSVHHPASIDHGQMVFVGPDLKGVLGNKMNQAYQALFFSKGIE